MVIVYIMSIVKSCLQCYGYSLVLMDPCKDFRDLQEFLQRPLKVTNVEGGLVGSQGSGIQEGDLVTVFRGK